MEVVSSFTPSNASSACWKKRIVSDKADISRFLLSMTTSRSSWMMDANSNSSMIRDSSWICSGRSGSRGRMNMSAMFAWSSLAFSAVRRNASIRSIFDWDANRLTSSPSALSAWLPRERMVSWSSSRSGTSVSGGRAKSGNLPRQAAESAKDSALAAAASKISLAWNGSMFAIPTPCQFG